MSYLEKEKVFGKFTKDEFVIYRKEGKKGFAKIIDIINNDKQENYVLEQYLLEDFKTKVQFKVDIDADYFFIDEIRFDKILFLFGVKLLNKMESTKFQKEINNIKITIKKFYNDEIYNSYIYMIIIFFQVEKTKV